MVEFTVCPGLRQRDLFSEFARLSSADRMDGIGESAMIPNGNHESPGLLWAVERTVLYVCYCCRGLPGAVVVTNGRLCCRKLGGCSWGPVLQTDLMRRSAVTKG